MEAVSVFEIMRECQGMVEPHAQKRGIQLNFLPIDSNWYVNADRIRVKQALINLLSNAIKYNRDLRQYLMVKCSKLLRSPTIELSP